MKNAVLNLNLFPLHTRHALLVVALKLYTNYDAKVIKVLAVHTLRSSFFRSVAHADVILENSDLQPNALNSKSIWCILILKIVYYSI